LFEPKRQSEDTRPRLALRVAVTGARTLNAGRIGRLRAEVDEVLDFVRTELAELAKRDAVAKFYGADAVPILRLLSPLARGADRLVAHSALDRNFSLYVPMPFGQEEYERDFTGIDPAKAPEAVRLSAQEDLGEFRSLLARAGEDWFALDGDREDENRAYENVGRFVVRNCDFLIAIWNGKPAAGRGGTAEIIEYAAANGVPVWWIHAVEERPPVWIASVQGLRADLDGAKPVIGTQRRLSEEAAVSGTAAHDLKTYLRRQFEPPRPIARQSHSWLERLARLGQGRETSFEAEYFATSPGFLNESLRNNYAKTYIHVMRWASGCNPPWTPPRQPSDPVAGYWFSLYQPTDTRASEYAALYRSTYVWLFLLATAAVVFGAAAAVSHGTVFALPAIFLEAVTLLLIGLSVAFAIRGEWHERSIDYRLLAELCRKQQVLALLGQAVSLGALRRVMLRKRESERQKLDISGSEAAAIVDRTGWVTWIFASWERAAPMPRGNISEALSGVIQKDVLEGLIEEQLQYHRDRAEMASHADETFFHIGNGSFTLVFILVIVKFALVLLGHAPTVASHVASGLSALHVISEAGFGFLTWLTIVLPAISAAAFGIRSYTELQLLVEQSSQMREELLLAKVGIEQMKQRAERGMPRRPFLSDDLAADIHALAMLMLQDLEGWARLFIGKSIEP